MNLRLKIDGLLVDIDQSTKIGATHNIADIQEPDNSSAGYSKSVELPFTPRNFIALRYTNELYSKEQFNNELHTAEYIVDDNIVMSGIAQIDKITHKYVTGKKLPSGSFHVSVIGSAFEWITNARRPINELVSTEVVKYTDTDVYNNSVSEGVSLIKFFLIDRGAFWVENSAGDKVVRKLLDLKDYHPFFNVWKTLQLIFDGYTINTSMQELLEKLYCSGYMPVNEDLSYIKEENDFFIGTSATKEEHISLGTIGKNNPTIDYNIYDVWDSGDYHNEHGAIVPLDPMLPKPCFLPKDDAVVQFETNLHFLTGVQNGTDENAFFSRIKELGECAFADQFELNVGGYTELVKLTLDQCVEAEDKYGDVESIIIPIKNSSHIYVVYIELSDAINSLGDSLYVNRPSQARRFVNSCKRGGNWCVVTLGSGSGSAYFTLSDGTVLDKRTVSKFYYFEIYIQNNAQVVTFKLDNITRKANTFLKNDKYPIWGQFSYSWTPADDVGSTNIASVYLAENNNIRPEFPNIIGYGDDVTISTIGGTNTQLDILSAIRQMFNLMFYTNSLTREIIIEPRTKFYNLSRAKIVDWRGKIDYSHNIEVQELGSDVGNAMHLAYAEGNDVVKYYNWKNRTELGAFTVTLFNKVSDETKEVANPLFTPFLRRAVDSVGIIVPQEKRESTEDLIDDVDLNITPIIGYFDGVVNRSAGDDRTIYPKYSQLIFQDAKKNINIGFDDVADDSAVVAGLHQYYEDNISAYNSGKRITIYMKLEPQDIEAILFPNRLMRDLRACYLLNMDGEDVPCLLESIVDYNAANGGSTKCTFISDPNIKLTD